MWNIPTVLSVRPVSPFISRFSHPNSLIEPLPQFSVKRKKKRSCFFRGYRPSTIIFLCVFYPFHQRLPQQLSFLFFCDWFFSVSFPPSPRVQQSRPAFRISAARAVLRGLPHRPAVSRKWCHNDRERKLRTNRWQNLRRWPFPDGEH